MSEATERRLADYFAEPNRRLYELLGRDLGWRVISRLDRPRLAHHVRLALRPRRRPPPAASPPVPAEERLVFVVGCPRSGTTFMAGAIGSQPGFVDLGEVHPLKGAIPSLAGLPETEAAPQLRRVLERVRRLGLAQHLRGVEQTPETAFVLPAALAAYPAATAVHVVRDGRDVVCSLLERGWLSSGRTGADDARLAYGSQARFWVEPDGSTSSRLRATPAGPRGPGDATSPPRGRCPSELSRCATSSRRDPEAGVGRRERPPHRPEAAGGALGEAHRARSAAGGRTSQRSSSPTSNREAGDLLRELGYA